jgi:DNA polymerase elongation subunit (family B)
MSIKKIIDKVIEENKIDRKTCHEYKGKYFYVILLERSGGTVIPNRFIRKGFDHPALFIFKTNKKGTLFGWYSILEFEIMNRKVYQASDELIIDNSVLTPVEEFNEQQAIAMINGTYYDLHDKYLDIYSIGETIVAIYRDRFTGMRCRKTIRGFDWYFYIEKKDYNKMMSVLAETNFDRVITKTEVSGEFLRVYCRNFSSTPWTKEKQGDPAYMIVGKLNGRIQTYEADISLSERYMIDNHIMVDTDVKILYYDIETDDSTRQIDMDHNPILSIGAVDSDGNEFFKVSSNEEELIKWWMLLSKDYDIYIGYNCYNFDAPYIQTRGKMHGCYWAPNYKPWRAGHIDMMKRIIGSYGKFTDIRSFSLESVSQYFLGRGKVQHEEKIIELFHNNRTKLKQYNLTDCRLLKELDEVLGVSRLMVAMCGWTGCFPTIFKQTTNMSGISVARMLDIFILRLAKDKHIHYPTVIWADEKEEGPKFEGAYVMEPVPGLYDNVHIFDFKSLYPTIIWSWKISPENVRKDKRTKEELIESANNIYFYKNREALFPMLIEQLLHARKEYRKIMTQYTEGSTEYKKYDVMQQVAKELTNSMYGALGQRGSRYFDFEVASAVTAAGRYLIKKGRDIVNDRGLKVIYGDTDSMFVVGIDGDPSELARDVTTALNENIRETFGVDKSIIELQYDKKFNRFISVAMKNYAGVREGKDKPDIKGLDCVKKSTISIAKREQEQLLYELLKKNYPLHYYQEKIRKLKEDFYNTKPSIEDIVQKTSISKHPDKLKTLQPHARVAKQLIEQKREFYIGMQIPYIITDKKGKGVVHVDDFTGAFDREYYWERLYVPLARVLSACFPTFDWGVYKDKKPRAIRKIAPPREEVKRGRFLVKKKVGKFILKQKKTRFVIKKTEHNQLFV